MCVVCGSSFGVCCRYFVVCFVFCVCFLVFGLRAVCGCDVWCSGLNVCYSLFADCCLLIVDFCSSFVVCCLRSCAWCFVFGVLCVLVFCVLVLSVFYYYIFVCVRVALFVDCCLLRAVCRMCSFLVVAF